MGGKIKKFLRWNS